MLNRSVFSNFGDEKRNKVQDKLVPLIVSNLVSLKYKRDQIKVKENIKKEFCQIIFNKDIEYGECKKWLLAPDEDDIFRRVKQGSKSDGLLNRLIDNLFEIITDNPLNTDPVFSINIIENVNEVLKSLRFEELLLKSRKDIEAI